MGSTTEGSIGGPDEPAHQGTFTIDELAARLEHDPVVVQQTLGNGSRDDVDAALTALARQADYPVYVAMVDPPAGLSDYQPAAELATLLHARIGEDGLYVVALNDDLDDVGWQTYGAGVPSQIDVPSAAAAYDPDAPRQSSAGAVAEVLATASGRPIDDSHSSELWTLPTITPVDDPVGAPVYVAVATSVAVGLTLSVYVVLRTVARWRELSAVVGSRDPRGRPAAVREAAEHELDELADTLEHHASRHRSAADQDALVEGCRSAAESLLAELPDTIHQGSAAHLDAIGALVLIRMAREAVDSPDGTPYRPCFFDPCHGRGTSETTVSAAGADVVVPVCPGCQRALKRQETPDALLELRRVGGPRPYFAGDSLWARTGYGTFTDELWRAVADRGVRR